MAVFFKALMVKMALLDPPDISVTEVALSAVLGPDGDTDTERFTVPLNPFMLVRVRLEVPDELRAMVIEDRLAVIEKSGASLIETRTEVECERELLFPATVTV
jgi:hypothetical protein